MSKKNKHQICLLPDDCLLINYYYFLTDVHENEILRGLCETRTDPSQTPSVSQP